MAEDIFFINAKEHHQVAAYGKGFVPLQDRRVVGVEVANETHAKRVCVVSGSVGPYQMPRATAKEFEFAAHEFDNAVVADVEPFVVVDVVSADCVDGGVDAVHGRAVVEDQRFDVGSGARRHGKWLRCVEGCTR